MQWLGVLREMLQHRGLCQVKCCDTGICVKACSVKVCNPDMQGGGMLGEVMQLNQASEE